MSESDIEGSALKQRRLRGDSEAQGPQGQVRY